MTLRLILLTVVLSLFGYALYATYQAQGTFYPTDWMLIIFDVVILSHITFRKLILNKDKE